MTGQVLQELTLREGQTRSALMANFQVLNASIRTLQVTLPLTNEDEIKTVAPVVRQSVTWSAPHRTPTSGKFSSNGVWSAKSSSVLNTNRAGIVRTMTKSSVQPSSPQARQLAYFMGVRAGGRLEIELDALPPGWQRVDWDTVPPALREAGNRHVPALVLRAVAPASPLVIHATRHALVHASSSAWPTAP